MIAEIQQIIAREILDSRGLPTVEAEVIVADNIVGRASVPSGSSTGTKEAVELRDGDNKRYLGRGVLKAVNNINTIIAPNLIGFDAGNQNLLDQTLCQLDGTANKANLGANAILAVSLACAVAVSKKLQLPLFRYLGGLRATKLPIPMMNVINGGKHANNNLDLQEFMIVPILAGKPFSEKLRCGAEIFHALKQICAKRGFSVAVGDEGGFAPNLTNHAQALDLILEAIDATTYIAGTDVTIALDCAASEFFHDNCYHLQAEQLKLTASQFIDYLENLCSTYPISSIEDGISEFDSNGWVELTQRLGGQIQLVGDDVFVTNPQILESGIRQGIANSLLVKVNQIGTLTEAITAVNIAHRSGYSTVMSHRSGETEDTFIADLAVALNCNYIKTGALSRSERVAKYNQLLRIEEYLLKVQFSPT